MPTKGIRIATQDYDALLLISRQIGATPESFIHLLCQHIGNRGARLEISPLWEDSLGRIIPRGSRRYPKTPVDLSDLDVDSLSL